MQRALVFTHLLEQMAIVINDGELIVGERGPAPKAVSTYPEICCHSLQDLDILNSRERIPYRVSAEARNGGTICSSMSSMLRPSGGPSRNRESTGT